MVQHAAAIDVVERAEPEFADIEQRTAFEADVGEAASLGPCHRHLLARFADVEVGHRAGHAGVGHLLRQHDRRVAGAAAGDQRVQR